MFFSRYKQRPRHKTGNELKRPIPATDGKANPIGSYSNGCIIGAEPLPYKGEGYQVIRMNKNRYYGHPDMIAYLQRLGQKAKSAGLPTMLVGGYCYARWRSLSNGACKPSNGIRRGYFGCVWVP